SVVKWRTSSSCTRPSLPLTGPHATARQPIRCALCFNTAAFWLMHAVRSAIPKLHPLTKAEFVSIRERLLKIGGRYSEHVARIRVHLPASCPERALFRIGALSLMPAAVP